jgi:hypothetical protein
MIVNKGDPFKAAHALGNFFCNKPVNTGPYDQQVFAHTLSFSSTVRIHEPGISFKNRRSHHTPALSQPLLTEEKQPPDFAANILHKNRYRIPYYLILYHGIPFLSICCKQKAVFAEQIPAPNKRFRLFAKKDKTKHSLPKRRGCAYINSVF